MSRLTFSRCVTVATAPPGTRDFDVRATSTIVPTTGALTTQPASTSYKPIDATAPQDSWESTARRRYPFAQRGTTPARMEADASTIRPTTAANAQSASPASIVPQTWMTVSIICARYVRDILSSAALYRSRSRRSPREFFPSEITRHARHSRSSRIAHSRHSRYLW